MTVPGVDRRHSVDFLRFIAAFGIVWAHMLTPDPSATVGYASLALFLMLVPYLSILHIERKTERPGRFRGLVRIRRIALPWIFWSIVFKALIALQMRDPAQFFQLNEPRWLLIGPTIHLWFLPFILLATAIFVPLSRRIDTARTLWVACGCAVVISIASLYFHDSGRALEPFAQWAFSLPPFLYGLLAAYGEKLDAPWPPALFLISVTVGFWILGSGFWPPFFLLALAALHLALTFEVRNPLFVKLGSLAFGIYLIHPFFMLVWYFLVQGGANNTAGAVFVFTASAVATAIMRRMPMVREVV